MQLEYLALLLAIAAVTYLTALRCSPAFTLHTTWLPSISIPYTKLGRIVIVVYAQACFWDSCTVFYIVWSALYFYTCYCNFEFWAFYVSAKRGLSLPVVGYNEPLYQRSCRTWDSWLSNSCWLPAPCKYYALCHNLFLSVIPMYMWWSMYSNLSAYMCRPRS